MKPVTLLTIAFAGATIALTACKKDEEKAPAPVAEDTYYVKATLDGQPFSYADGKNNYEHSSYFGFGPGINNNYQLAMGIEMKPANSNNNRLYVAIDSSFPQEPTVTQKAAVWHTGDYTYSVGSQYSGANITFFDATGKVWTSAQGNNQTGSTFTVTETTPYTSAVGSQGKICKGTFSCKLYSPEGEVKTMTNATFRGIVVHGM